MVNFYFQAQKANLKMVAMFMQCQIHPKIKKSKKGHNQKITLNQGPEDYLNPQNLDPERSQNPQNLDPERSQNPQNLDQERSQNLEIKEIEKSPSLLHHPGQNDYSFEV